MVLLWKLLFHVFPLTAGGLNSRSDAWQQRVCRRSYDVIHWFLANYENRWFCNWLSCDCFMFSAQPRLHWVPSHRDSWYKERVARLKCRVTRPEGFRLRRWRGWRTGANCRSRWRHHCHRRHHAYPFSTPEGASQYEASSWPTQASTLVCLKIPSDRCHTAFVLSSEVSSLWHFTVMRCGLPWLAASHLCHSSWRSSQTFWPWLNETPWNVKKNVRQCSQRLEVERSDDGGRHTTCHCMCYKSLRHM